MKKEVSYPILMISAFTVITGCSVDDTVTKMISPSQKWNISTNVIADNSNETRALSESANGLTAIWSITDKVYVSSDSYQSLGYLQPSIEDKNTILTGAIAATGGAEGKSFNVNDKLYLTFPKEESNISYQGQTGSLGDLSDNYDFAIAEVNVATIDDESHSITTTDASFENQQAICKFTFQAYDTNTNNWLEKEMTNVSIEAASGKLVSSMNKYSSTTTYGPLNLDFGSSASSFFVAMRNDNLEDEKDTYLFTASDGTNLYRGTKRAKILNGSYYETNVHMKTNGSIHYDIQSVIKETGNESFINPLTVVGDGTIEYSSSNPSVASVNSSTGEVTILGEGTTVITATASEGSYYYYSSLTESYNLYVYTAIPSNLSDLKNLVDNGKVYNPFVGYYVDSSGGISVSQTSSSIGFIVDISKEDIASSGRRILVMGIDDVGNYPISTSADLKDVNFTYLILESQKQTQAYNFCMLHKDDEGFPAIYYAYRYNNGNRPRGQANGSFLVY